jgi:hypothetical protein
MKAKLIAACAAVLMAGCASYDGRGLTTLSQVESTMGRPAMRVSASDGSSVLYYPRAPLGRHTYAVTVGPDGAVRGIEDRLTLANIGKLRIGSSTKKDVQELLGPAYPHSMSVLALNGREVWEYLWLDMQEKRVLWVQFSADGILREVYNSRDDFHETPGGGMAAAPPDASPLG